MYLVRSGKLAGERADSVSTRCQKKIEVEAQDERFTNVRQGGSWLNSSQVDVGRCMNWRGTRCGAAEGGGSSVLKSTGLRSLRCLPLFRPDERNSVFVQLLGAHHHIILHSTSD